MIVRNILLIFIFLIPIISASAATIDVSASFITTNNGLSNNTVRNIFQDSKGFIWLATLNGLNRYDGHSFITFMPEIGDKISLADNRVEEITEDKNGFLWIYTTPEIFSCYDLERACFVDYTGCGEYHEMYRKKMVTNNGDIWLSHHQNGCRRIRYENGQFTSTVYKVERGNLPSNKVTKIIEDTEGTVWICTQAGIVKVANEKSETIGRGLSIVTGITHKDQCFFLTREGEIYQFRNNRFSVIKKLATNKTTFNHTGSFWLEDDWIIFTSSGSITFNMPNAQLKANTILDIRNGQCTFDDRGNCWIYNGSGYLYYIDPTTKKVRNLQLMPQPLVRSIAYEYYHIIHDMRGIIWISTYGNGLYAYDPNTENLTHFTYQIVGPNIISSNYLSQVMEDRQGNIWTAAEHAGVSFLSVLNEGALRIFPESETLVDRSNVVRMITKMKNGEIWIGNRNGSLYQYDKNLKLKQKRNIFPYSIFSSLEDSQGNIWIGSRGGGLNINNKWYTKNEGDENSISNNNIFDIFNDSKDRIWIGTFGGGLALATATGNEYQFKHFFQTNYNESRIRKVIEDKNGWLWMATNNGAYTFHPDSLILDSDNYHIYNFNNGKLNSNEIHSIYADSKGHIWIGTAGTGFSVCQPKGNYENLSFRHYNTNDGLINNLVQSIIEDKEGRMWIATEYGISRFDIKTNFFENFFFSASTLGNYYSETSSVVMDNGNLLFGTDHGFVVINPEKVMPQHYISEVVFTGLKINGIPMEPNDPDSPLTKAFSHTDLIELKHFQNSLIIEFSTFDFSFTGGSKYIYKLDKFDEEWSIPSTLNFASYKNLSPGHYKLHVKASNASGIWANNEAILNIIIKPPFWKTHWAIVIYIIIICMILFIVYKLIHNFGTLQNRIKLEKQLTEYKLVFFTNIAHEFRAPLTLIQGGLEKMAQNSDMPDTAIQPMHTIKNSSKRLMRLIDQLLMFRKMQNNKLRLAIEETDVIILAENIFRTFHEAAHSKNIIFSYQPFDKSYNMYIDKSFFDKILYNLLSNAIKYTPANGKITLSLSLNSTTNHLIIKVIDTGIGVTEDKRKELFHRFAHIHSTNNSFGIGLHLTKELVTVHKGNISYEPNQEQGSIFTVCLPLDKNLYQEKDFASSYGSVIEEESDVKIEFTEKVNSQTPINNIKLLIIDDDEDIREYLRNILCNYFITKVANDGHSGIALVEEFKPDIILCDVLMPDTTGYEITRQLKIDKKTSHIPIILLTSLSEDEDKMEGFEAGADDFITKPFSVRLLLTRIINIIEQRMELREQFGKEDVGPARSLLLSNDHDKIFINRLDAVIDHNMSDALFDVDTFATSMGYKRTIFYRKVKDITGITPNEYLRNARLKKAGELLLDDRLTISEVCYRVGFTEPSYFSKSFKAYYGMTPKQFHQNKKEEIE